jgi:hypothetical protein
VLPEFLAREGTTPRSRWYCTTRSVQDDLVRILIAVRSMLMKQSAIQILEAALERRFLGGVADPEGKPVTMGGRSAEVVRRQSDGTWKFVTVIRTAPTHADIGQPTAGSIAPQHLAPWAGKNPRKTMNFCVKFCQPKSLVKGEFRSTAQKLGLLQLHAERQSAARFTNDHRTDSRWL